MSAFRDVIPPKLDVESSRLFSRSRPEAVSQQIFDIFPVP
mgnify:CR=1 FL=1